MSASQATPDDRSTGFVSVQGADESTSASSLLVSAYVVMWALLLGFLFMGWRKQQRIEARLADLDRALSREATADPHP